MSKVARHPRHPAVVNMSLEEIAAALYGALRRHQAGLERVRRFELRRVSSSAVPLYRRNSRQAGGETYSSRCDAVVRDVRAAGRRQCAAHASGRRGVFHLERECDGVLRGRRWPARRGKSRPLGLCLMPGRGHSRISKQRPRSGLPAGDGGANQTRADGLRRCEA